MAFPYVAFGPDMLHSPPSFRNSSQVAGISRVCTGCSNNPDIVRYTHFLPLMRRTISLCNPWVWGEQKARQMLDAAGFTQLQVMQVEGDIFNNYFIASKSETVYLYTGTLLQGESIIKGTALVE